MAEPVLPSGVPEFDLNLSTFVRNVRRLDEVNTGGADVLRHELPLVKPLQY